ncbi:MAG: amidohydrolase family protein [Planctomycetes bacterium]|nr:amidohydrolase family protein [Planctomycetota bacterium]
MLAALPTLLLAVQAVFIDGGTVHPMDGTPTFAGDVLVVDGVITAVGPELEPPDGGEVVDARGLHVLPGLIDGMIHHDGEHDPLYTRAGVVLARDMGNDLGRVIISRARRARADATGPRLFICGAVLDGLPPITTKAVVVRTAEEAEAKLSRLMELQVDFISTHTGIPHDALVGASGAARASGLQVWGPAPRGAGLDQAFKLGLDGLIGLDAFLPDRYGWVADEAPDLSEAIPLAVDDGRAVMPVLNAVAARVRLPSDPAETLALMGPHYVAQWSAELEARERLGGPSYYARGQLALMRQQELLADLYGAGARLVPGSGAPNPWVVPGDGLHDELALWVSAGVPPGEALRAATFGAATLLGFGDKSGSIDEGKLGDLMLVSGDPRIDITSLRRPEFVILRGQIFSKGDLEESVQELKHRQSERREAATKELVVPELELPEGEVLLASVVQTDAYGGRIGMERYAIVAGDDGRTSYCSRSVIPASATEGESRIQFRQVIQNNRVQEFAFVMDAQGSKIEIQGIRVGGQLRVERRVDGLYLDNSSTTEAIALIDTGSATAPLVVAHHLAEGSLKALYFDDLEPAVANWELEVKASGILAMMTGEGPMVALFEQGGALSKMERTRGNTVIRQYAVSVDLMGGDGLPLPPERLPSAAGSDVSGGQK